MNIVSVLDRSNLCAGGYKEAYTIECSPEEMYQVELRAAHRRVNEEIAGLNDMYIDMLDIADLISVREYRYRRESAFDQIMDAHLRRWVRFTEEVALWEEHIKYYCQRGEKAKAERNTEALENFISGYNVSPR